MDLAQLDQLPTALPADQGLTQGDAIAHILGERYYSVIHGNAGFDTSHDYGAFSWQNQFRRDIGATMMVVSQGPTGDPFGYGTDFRVTFDNGYTQDLALLQNDLFEIAKVINPAAPRP